jgi:hypothetical protein
VGGQSEEGEESEWTHYGKRWDYLGFLLRCGMNSIIERT